MAQLNQATKTEKPEDFKPVYYSGTYGNFYCSYEEIIAAIESWAKVKAILTKSDRSTHVFIVNFRQPIRLLNRIEGLTFNTINRIISEIPFYLQPMISPEGPGVFYCILSETMMAFSIRCMDLGSFNASDLITSHTLVPDE